MISEFSRASLVNAAAVVVLVSAASALAAQPVYSPVQSGRTGVFILSDEPISPVATGGTAVGTTLTPANQSGPNAPLYTAVTFGPGGPTVALAGRVANESTVSSDINSSGIAAGYLEPRFPKTSSWGQMPAIWNQAGTPTVLGLLGINESAGGGGRALAINNAGTVVGGSTLNDGLNVYPTRWAAGSTTPTRLNTADGAPGFATLINDAGTIVGLTIGNPPAGSGGPYFAFRWESDSTTGTALPALGAGLSTTARAINAAGTIVGNATAPAGTPGGSGTRAVRWDATTNAIAPLDTLDTDAAGAAYSVAYDINDAGTAVGVSTIHPTPSTVTSLPTRWLAGSTAVEALAIPAGSNAIGGYAVAINEAGFTVGAVSASGGPNRAVVWMPDGSALLLNSLIDPASGWSLNVAQGISNDNWVTGYGTYDPDGPGGIAQTTASFVIQVPEPTAAVAVCGALGLIVRRRNRSAV